MLVIIAKSTYSSIEIKGKENFKYTVVIPKWIHFHVLWGVGQEP